MKLLLFLALLLQTTPAPKAPSGGPAKSGAPAASASIPFTPSSGPRVVLESAQGTLSTRSLSGFESTDPRLLDAHFVRFEGLGSGQAWTTGTDTAQLVLAGGDRLHGELRAGGSESLTLEIAGNVRVIVGLEELASLTFPGRVPRAWSTPLQAPAEGDRIYRLKGETLERIDGGVEEFGADGLRFHGALVGALTVRWDEVVALFVEVLGGSPKSGSASGAGRAAAPSVPAVIDVLDGSRLSGRLERIDERAVKLVYGADQKLQIPNTAVALVSIDDGRFVFLSALAPAEAREQSPFGDDLGMRWPHLVDRAVNGAALTAGGRVHARGLGVHAPSRLVWKLDGTFRSLRGAVAIDDQVLLLAARGAVIFRVYVDGAKRWESGLVRGGDAPVTLALDPASLEGAHELALEVDPAADSFIADRADWLDLVLVRAP